MNQSIINLEDYRTVGSKVFTGRDRGGDVRKRSQIDLLADSTREVVIQVPADIRSINPSFLEEFLYNVVQTLGREAFHEQVKFNFLGTRYDIAKDVDEAVDRILRKKNALAYFQ